MCARSIALRCLEAPLVSLNGLAGAATHKPLDACLFMGSVVFNLPML